MPLKIKSMLYDSSKTVYSNRFLRKIKFLRDKLSDRRLIPSDKSARQRRYGAVSRRSNISKHYTPRKRGSHENEKDTDPSITKQNYHSIKVNIVKEN